MHRARLAEPVCLQVLGDGVGRGQSDHPVPGLLVRIPDRGKGKTLPRSGPAFDDLSPPSATAWSNAAR